MFSDCSAPFSGSTKNVQNRVFLQISDQMPKGFHCFQLFENMIADPPSKLISCFRIFFVQYWENSINRECCKTHFSQFYFGSDAAQPPEIDSKFVEKTVILTKYGGLWPGNEVSRFEEKLKLRSFSFHLHRLHSQSLEYSKGALSDIGLNHWPSDRCLLLSCNSEFRLLSSDSVVTKSGRNV